jgi:hypothetical protein
MRGRCWPVIAGLIIVVVVAGIPVHRILATQGGGYFADTPSGTAAVCAEPGQWLLLYWRGGEAPIATAAAACPASDRFWASSGGRWLGYAPAAPREANDEFTVVPGQALFVHGGASQGTLTLIGTLTFVVGDPAPGSGGGPALRARLIDDQGQSHEITIDDRTTVISGPLASLNGRRVRIVGETAGPGGAVHARTIEPVS